MTRRIRQKKRGSVSSSLDGRLVDYSCVVCVSTASEIRQRRVRNWSVYAAATGSALAMATGASASIIHTGIVGRAFAPALSVNPGGPYTHLGLIPGLSVKIHALDNLAGPTFQLQLEASHANLFASDAALLAKNFALGAPLAPDSIIPSGPTAIVKAFASSSLFGNFTADKPAFAGFSFTTANHQHDYGWIELEFHNDSSGHPYYLDALAYGIDLNPGQTPGTLQAGQVDDGFIPEPGTLSLAFLASGAAGVMALRRRRKQSGAVNAGG